MPIRFSLSPKFQTLSRLSSEVHSINYRNGVNLLESFNEWNYRKRQWYHITQYEDALQVYLQVFDEISHSYPKDVTTIVQFFPCWLQHVSSHVVHRLQRTDLCKECGGAPPRLKKKYPLRHRCDPVALVSGNFIPSQGAAKRSGLKYPSIHPYGTLEPLTEASLWFSRHKLYCGARLSI
jgi:hypothetical protein